MFNNSNTSKVEWLCAILFYVMSGPFFCWGIINNTPVRLLITVVLYLCFIHYRKRIDNKDLGLILFWGFTLVYSFSLALYQGQSNFFGLVERLVWLPMAFYAFGTDLFSNGVFKKFLNIYAVVILLSVICYPFALLGIIPPLGTSTGLEQQRIYQIYPFLVREITGGLDDLTRFCGPFDEPGVVGTYGALLLFIGNFKFNKWQNIVILISGLLSMSMFFYAILFVYGVLYLVLVKKNLLLPLLMVASLAVLYNYTKDNTYFYELMWKRFEWDSANGQFIGDDRIDQAADEYYKKNVVGTTAYWFGLSDPSIFNNLAKGSCSYKAIVARNGMIYLALYILFFVFLAKKYSKNTWAFLMFCLILLLNSYQRPSTYAPIIVFMYAYAARRDAIESTLNPSFSSPNSSNR